MARRDSAGVRLFTRRGLDWTRRYPSIAAAVATLSNTPGGADIADFSKQIELALLYDGKLVLTAWPHGRQNWSW
jgi:hypothetical protein